MKINEHGERVYTEAEANAMKKNRYEVYMQLAGMDSNIVWDNLLKRKLKPKEVIKLLNSNERIRDNKK